MATPLALLVTGASRRLGRAIALRLVQEGYAIALHYHSSEQDAKDLKQDIETQGGVCALFQADLKDRATCVSLIEDVYRVFPSLCGVIHNASIFTESSFLETDEVQLEAYIAIHLKAPFWLTQCFALTVKQGTIITLLDTDILHNSDRFFTYILSKRMLAEFTMMSAKVLAPSIRVNAIAPGKVLPSMECDEAYLEKKKTQLPLRTLPTPDDIAASAVLLLQTPYLTGHVLFVDGGGAFTMIPCFVDIAITDLAVDMIIGVRPHERKRMQKIILELYLTYDASDAMVSDAMEDVVDYWQLSKEITEWLRGASYFLLETLLQDVLSYVMKDKRIKTSKIIIHKPKALAQFGAKVSLSGSAERH